MNTLSLVEKIALLSDSDKEWLERLLDRVLVSQPSKGCGCHVIDPKKSDIIIWPSANPKHPNDLIVKVMNQKFIGMPRVDKRGMKYWKVRDFYENESDNEPTTLRINSSLSQRELELLKSYQEKVKADTPMKDFSKAEVDAYVKWSDEQEAQKKLPAQSEKPYEPVNP